MPTLRQVYLRHAQHYCNVAREAAHLYLEGETVRGLDLFDLEREQIEEAFNRLESMHDQQSHSLVLSLVDGVAPLAQLRLTPLQRVHWRERELKAAHLLRDVRRQCIALDALGSVYVQLGDGRKALDFFMRAWASSRRVDVDSWFEGHVLGNIGNAQLILGNAHASIEFNERALTIARHFHRALRSQGLGGGNLGLREDEALMLDRSLGRWEVTALLNICSACLKLDPPDTAKAIQLGWHVRSLARRERDSSAESTALHILGSAYHISGELEWSVQLNRQALQIATTIGERGAKAIVLIGLRDTYAKLNDPRVFDLTEQALAAAREAGEQGTLLANALWGAAVASDDERQRMARAEEALGIYEDLNDRHSADKVRELLSERRARCSSQLR